MFNIFKEKDKEKTKEDLVLEAIIEKLKEEEPEWEILGNSSTAWFYMATLKNGLDLYIAIDPAPILLIKKDAEVLHSFHGMEYPFVINFATKLVEEENKKHGVKTKEEKFEELSNILNIE